VTDAKVNEATQLMDFLSFFCNTLVSLQCYGQMHHQYSNTTHQFLQQIELLGPWAGMMHGGTHVIGLPRHFEVWWKIGPFCRCFGCLLVRIISSCIYLLQSTASENGLLTRK
jgi:hypothetical protein